MYGLHSMQRLFHFTSFIVFYFRGLVPVQMEKGFLTISHLNHFPPSGVYVGNQ